MNIKSALKIIKVSGFDAGKFLQGQLTCDIKVLTENKLQLAAHCNVKGRIESLFEIFKCDENFYLLLPSSISEHAFTTLKKYAVFSKVTLTLQEVDTSLIPQDLPDNFEDWRLQQIKKGLATLFPQTIGKFLPHDLNLPQLGAVSFNKGCYLGQEIVARMQNIGKPKYHMIQSQASGLPGDELEDGSIVVDSVNGEALLVTVI